MRDALISCFVLSRPPRDVAASPSSLLVQPVSRCCDEQSIPAKVPVPPPSSLVPLCSGFQAFFYLPSPPLPVGFVNPFKGNGSYFVDDLEESPLPCLLSSFDLCRAIKTQLGHFGPYKSSGWYS